MPLNDPFAGSWVQTPRPRLLFQGRPIPGLFSLTVTRSSLYKPATFSASLAAAETGTGSQSWWASLAPDQPIEAQFSIDGNSWVSMLVGYADRADQELIEGTVNVSGRDVLGALCTTQISAVDVNQTSSQIVSAIISAHGLTPDVAATDTPVGRYFNGEHRHAGRHSFGSAKTEFDLVTQLAMREQMDIWATGNTVHMQPFITPSTAPLYVVHYFPGGVMSGPTPGGAPTGGAVVATSNALSLRVSRHLTLARNLSVTVQSWHGKSGSAVTTAATMADVPTSDGAHAATAQKYFVSRPDLTPEQATRLANSILFELAKNERQISVSMPGDFNLDIRTGIALRDTGTAYDQTYFPDRIEYEMSMDGFTMHATARNVSPRAMTRAT